jgi:hypothetical protein
MTVRATATGAMLFCAGPLVPRNRWSGVPRQLRAWPTTCAGSRGATSSWSGQFRSIGRPVAMTVGLTARPHDHVDVGVDAPILRIRIADLEHPGRSC